MQLNEEAIEAARRWCKFDYDHFLDDVGRQLQAFWDEFNPFLEFSATSGPPPGKVYDAEHIGLDHVGIVSSNLLHFTNGRGRDIGCCFPGKARARRASDWFHLPGGLPSDISDAAEVHDRLFRSHETAALAFQGSR